MMGYTCTFNLYELYIMPNNNYTACQIEKLSSRTIKTSITKQVFGLEIKFRLVCIPINTACIEVNMVQVWSVYVKIK